MPAVLHAQFLYNQPGFPAVGQEDNFCVIKFVTLGITFDF